LDINAIELPAFVKTIIFFLTCAAVMAYYYIEAWFKGPRTSTLKNYLIYDNPAATWDAIKRLALLSAGAGIVGHMDVVENTAVLISGAGVGWLAYSGGNTNAKKKEIE